jgi:diadenosine tetraphosphate (Ap4A) HIT family hydrolase
MTDALVDRALTGAHDVGGAADWKADRVAAARAGRNPTVLARLRTGWAAIGDYQLLPGYCVLLYDGACDHLHDLPRAERSALLDDVGLLGEAVAAACARLDPAFRRVNYEILGNTYPQLHAHVHPRYGWEPTERRGRPVWLYPDLHDQAHALDARHDELRVALVAELESRAPK